MRFRKRDPRVRDEIAYHRDRLIEDFIAAGMDRTEAERRARLEFGGPAQIEESVRDARGRWLEDVARDLQYAVRTLRRNPGFAAIAVLSLALGIGANAAIFSLINGVMLRTLPVREPGRLVQMTRLLEGRPGVVSYPLFEHFRANVRSIESAFAQVTSNQAIAVDGEEEFVTAELVSGAYGAVLGIDPAAGRLLGPGDDGESPVSNAAVIGDGYWSRRFGRSSSAIGRSITVHQPAGDRAFTIVGVLPPSYRSARAGSAPDLQLPLAAATDPRQRRSTDFNFLNVLARLKPGATVKEANAEVQVLFASFVQAQSAKVPEKDRAAILRQHAVAVAAPDGFNPIRDNIAQPLWILMGIVALILLLACVNLSGLLLARAAAREREISIRLAIGAGRGRLVRQLLTESLVLAALGGAAGLVVAVWLSERLFALFINGRDVTLSVSPDWRVLAFTSAVSVVACCVAGLVPALQAARVRVNPALKDVHAPGRRRLGEALVVAQLAVSMILIVGATLFVGTLVRLQTEQRGFESGGLLVVSVRMSRPFPPPRANVVRTALLDRLRAMPAVQSASAAQLLPVSGMLWDRSVRVEGYVFGSDESEKVGFNVIAPGYFATLGTPLMAGREFGERDTEGSATVAIVNESFARDFFGGQSALGRHVTSVDTTYEIVGVVRDAKYQNLRDRMIRTMYIPWPQRQGDQPSIYNYVIRVAAADPLRLVPALDSVVRQADPALRVRAAVSYDTVIDRSIATERIMATLGGFFGVLALLVAGVGLFGLLAFQVARRTNELGVRMALGASRGRLMGLVLRDVVVMLAAGVTIGSAAAFALARLARNLVFGLTPSDPAVFGTAAVVLSTAAVIAAWLPARRASHVDPLVALRHE